MEPNWRPGYQSTHLWTPDFWQSSKKCKMEKRKHIQPAYLHFHRHLTGLKLQFPEATFFAASLSDQARGHNWSWVEQQGTSHAPSAAWPSCLGTRDQEVAVPHCLFAWAQTMHFTFNSPIGGQCYRLSGVRHCSGSDTGVWHHKFTQV